MKSAAYGKADHAQGAELEQCVVEMGEELHVHHHFAMKCQAMQPMPIYIATTVMLMKNNAIP